MTNNELEENISEFKNLVYKLAYNNTCDLSVCDDIVQETFLALYNSGKAFEDKEQVKAWLIRVAINKSRNYTRSWWRAKRTDMLDSAEFGEADRDSVISLRNALSKLKADYRNIIFLHYYEGYQVKEISAILGISVTSVTTKLHRARGILKEYLKED